MREQILIKLGRKAVVGSNQYTEGKITNAELSNQLGISRRVYQYKKQVANINPKVQAMLGETKFANSMMDMVKLSKQPVEVQMEVARILDQKEANTFNRAFIIGVDRAKMRLYDVQQKVGDIVDANQVDEKEDAYNKFSDFKLWNT